jgi:hypothetical protein
VRIAGWILLVGGFFLCASVAWAALGFLWMGVGLIALQVAEQNRRRARSSPALIAEGADMRQDEPTAVPEPAPVTKEAARRTGLSVPSYDKEAWRRLVENDSELLRLTSILADYGEQYVDELAKDYLAAADKVRLPAIVDRIIATAKRNAGLRKMRPEVDRQSPISMGKPIAASSQNDPPHDRIAGDASKERKSGIGIAVRLRNDVAEETSGSAIAKETFANPPEPPQVRRNITVTSADDDLAEMIRKFTPDSTFLRKN